MSRYFLKAGFLGMALAFAGAIPVVAESPGRLQAEAASAPTPDIAAFTQRLRQILPDELIEVRTANGAIVLSGKVSNRQSLGRALALAQGYAPGRVSDLMTVGGLQRVTLTVRFAEMQRDVAQNLSGTNSGSSTLAPGFPAGAADFAALLQALEAKGALRMLAALDLTAVSGREISFGTELATPIPTSLGPSGQMDSTGAPFGIDLRFTPVVDDSTIELTVRSAVPWIGSQDDADGGTLHETSTTLDLRDGQSLVIAGLLHDHVRELIGRMPGLGDTQVLASLLASPAYRQGSTELVIIVTPRLAAADDAVAARIPAANGLSLIGKVLAPAPQHAAAVE